MITYVARYCAYSAWKKLQCNVCKLVLTSIDKNTNRFNSSLNTILNRGSLLYPSEDVILIVYFSYSVVENLSSTSAFQHLLQERNVSVETIMTLLVFEELNILLIDACSNSHQYADVAKMFIWVSANCLLNNYCSLKNDQIRRTKMTKRRKLSTLTN